MLSKLNKLLRFINKYIVKYNNIQIFTLKLVYSFYMHKKEALSLKSNKVVILPLPFNSYIN